MLIHNSPCNYQNFKNDVFCFHVEKKTKSNADINANIQVVLNIFQHALILKHLIIVDCYNQVTV